MGRGLASDAQVLDFVPSALLLDARFPPGLAPRFLLCLGALGLPSVVRSQVLICSLHILSWSFPLFPGTLQASLLSSPVHLGLPRLTS